MTREQTLTTLKKAVKCWETSECSTNCQECQYNSEFSLKEAVSSAVRLLEAPSEPEMPHYSEMEMGREK